MVLTHLESVRMTLLLVFCRIFRCLPAAQALTYIRSARPLPVRFASPAARRCAAISMPFDID
jgi:hypothetical protein